MENSIYLALSRQMVLRTNMDTIANNIANMSTSGFRAQNLLFEEYLSDPSGKTTDDAAGDDLSFVYDRGQYQTTAPGSLRFTGNPLNAALAGPGFFGVQGPNGETMYTRAGEFEKAPDGTLVTTGGFAVAGQGGGAITIPANSTELHIDETGAITNQNGQIGQLMVTEFENVQKLEPFGNNLYRLPNGEAANAATNTRVKQGEIEGSNVQAVVEMTRMIETLRSFQSNQNLLRTENDRLRSAIQKLTGS